VIGNLADVHEKAAVILELVCPKIILEMLAHRLHSSALIMRWENVVGDLARSVAPDFVSASIIIDMPLAVRADVDVVVVVG
jgi:hypothetical protein